MSRNLSSRAGGRQRYVSDELSHFVGRGLPSDEARYELLIKILLGGRLLHSANTPAEELLPPGSPAGSEVNWSVHVDTELPIDHDDAIQVTAVCFCDIPIADLGIHTEKYSPFGLAFDKTYLARRGASPVFYVARGSQFGVKLVPEEQSVTRSQAFATAMPGYLRLFDELSKEEGAAFQREVRESIESATRWDEASKSLESAGDDAERKAEALRELEAAMIEDTYLQQVRDARRANELANFGKEPTAMSQIRRAQDGGPSALNSFLYQVFFGFIKFFDETAAEDDPGNVYMEREWRVLGNVDFEVADIRRIFLPEEFAVRLHTDLPEYHGQIEFLNSSAC
jgi:hypothetical protein